MNRTCEWAGCIARLDFPTADNRVLATGPDPLIHWVRVPGTPVLVRSGKTIAVVGGIDRVSVQVPLQFHRSGRDVIAEGWLDLGRLFELRPELTGFLEVGADPLPVGIDAFGGEIRTIGHRTVIAGPWELSGLFLADGKPVWPGTGIQATSITLDAA